jgi:hypothetical protein
VPGEALRVDRGRGDDDLQVRPLGQQLLEVAEQEIDVEAALVRLVDDDRVVLGEGPVPVDLVQQDAVGHQLDACLGGHPVREPHLVAHQAADLGAELLGDALGDGAGGDAPGLGVADAGVTELEQDLRQLGRLAGSGRARDDDDLVVPDRCGDVVALLADRQLGRVGDDQGSLGLADGGGRGGRGRRYGVGGCCGFRRGG